jgi:hypothetical protein
MCPLEVVGQVYVHIDRANGVLGAIYFIEDRDRITDALYPDFVDFYVAMVFEALDVSYFFVLLTGH